MTSDALVVFGVTGDLAYKKIFPALQALVARRLASTPMGSSDVSGVNSEG